MPVLFGGAWAAAVLEAAVVVVAAVAVVAAAAVVAADGVVAGLADVSESAEVCAGVTVVVVGGVAACRSFEAVQAAGVAPARREQSVVALVGTLRTCPQRWGCLYDGVVSKRHVV